MSVTFDAGTDKELMVFTATVHKDKLDEVRQEPGRDSAGHLDQDQVEATAQAAWKRIANGRGGHSVGSVAIVEEKEERKVKS
jgi:hypothetical protein